MGKKKTSMHSTKSRIKSKSSRASGQSLDSNGESEECLSIVDRPDSDSVVEKSSVQTKEVPEKEEKEDKVDSNANQPNTEELTEAQLQRIQGVISIWKKNITKKFEQHTETNIKKAEQDIQKAYAAKFLTEVGKKEAIIKQLQLDLKKKDEAIKQNKDNEQEWMLREIERRVKEETDKMRTSMEQAFSNRLQIVSFAKFPFNYLF